MVGSAPILFGMWIQVDGVTVKEGNEPIRLAPPRETMDEAIYAVTYRLLPAREVDGVVSIPGRDPLPGGQACYWLTGTVGGDVLDVSQDKRSRFGNYRFLIAVGEMRFVAKYTEKRRKFRVEPGTRLTLECSFLLVSGWDWDMDDLPDDWSSNWRVLQILARTDPEFPMSDYVMEVEPVTAAPRDGGSQSTTPVDPTEDDGERIRRFLIHPGPFSGYSILGTQPLPLLLKVNDDGATLWYRRRDDTAAWEISPDVFRLSRSLHDRLLRRTDHHQVPHDPDALELGWRDEGLALLTALRSELGLGRDIKLSSDLDA